MRIDPRTPVLVGVGVVSQAVDDPGGGQEASQLMAAAARAAGADAGGTGLLRAVQQVSVPRGTWSYANPGRLVAAAIGAPEARTTLAEIGVP